MTLTNTAINAFRVAYQQQAAGIGFGGGAYIQADLSFDGSKVRIAALIPGLVLLLASSLHRRLMARSCRPRKQPRKAGPRSGRTRWR